MKTGRKAAVAASPASASAVTGEDPKAAELQRAFAVFNQVSAELTQAYATLQQKAARLADELAVANGELRRQYQEKEALSERLSLLLGALPAAVIVLDADGVVAETNAAAETFFAGALTGQRWREAGEPRLRATAAPDEWEIERQDGEGDGAAPRRVSVAESRLAAAGGRILVLHDVTQAHAMKQALERNSRLAAMGELAAGLAHQLRTPLSTALLYCGNLETPGLADDMRQRFAGRASEQLKRLERLIQDTLLFARGESIGREVIAAEALISDAVRTVEPLCSARRVRFVRHGELPDHCVVGDRKALCGALVNLLENALQVSAEGGVVELSAAIRADQLGLAVRDEGPGMDAALAARIFEPFFTTRSQGTGLGLAIALGVARAHGGNIAVAATPGHGSVFTLSLPCGRTDALRRAVEE